MTKREAFQHVSAAYADQKPTRAAGFTRTGDGTGVIIAGHDEAVAVVIYHENDLLRLMGMCEAALRTRVAEAIKKPKRRRRGKEEKA